MPHIIEHTYPLREKGLELLVIQLLGGEGRIIAEGLDICAEQGIRQNRTRAVQVTKKQSLEVVVAPPYCMHDILHPGPVLQCLDARSGSRLMLPDFIEIIRNFSWVNY